MAGWINHQIRLEASKPASQTPIEDTDRVHDHLRLCLLWTDPEVAVSPNSFSISMRLSATSAEAALVHARGIVRSVFTAAGVPRVNLWPVGSISVTPDPADTPEPAGQSPLAGTASAT